MKGFHKQPNRYSGSLSSIRTNTCRPATNGHKIRAQRLMAHANLQIPNASIEDELPIGRTKLSEEKRKSIDSGYSMRTLFLLKLRNLGRGSLVYVNPLCSSGGRRAAQKHLRQNPNYSPKSDSKSTSLRDTYLRFTLIKAQSK
jgi:hypothetical protein